jgi:hypothetical protein
VFSEDDLERELSKPAVNPVVKVLNSPWNWTIVVFATVILLLASISWPWGIRVGGEIVASSITFKLDRDTDITIDLGLLPPKVSVSGLEWIELPVQKAVGRMPAQNGEISADTLSLSTLRLQKNATLTISRDSDGEIQFRIGSAGANLEFSMSGPYSIKYDDATVTTPDTDKSTDQVILGTKGTTAVPLVAALVSKGSISISDAPISLLRFGRGNNDPTSTLPFSSSIDEGTLELIDVKDSHKLSAGSVIQLVGLQGYMTNLQSTPKGLRADPESC